MARHGCKAHADGAVNGIFSLDWKSGDRTGLGLGLSICSKAVKAMAGELRIRDLPGKGCIFTIELPRSVLPGAAPTGGKGVSGARDQ